MVWFLPHRPDFDFTNLHVTCVLFFWKCRWTPIWCLLTIDMAFVFYSSGISRTDHCVFSVGIGHLTCEGCFCPFKNCGWSLDIYSDKSCMKYVKICTIPLPTKHLLPSSFELCKWLEKGQRSPHCMYSIQSPYILLSLETYLKCTISNHFMDKFIVQLCLPWPR